MRFFVDDYFPLFHSDYYQCRQQFRAMVERIDFLNIEKHLYELMSLHEKNICSSDVVYIGNSQAEKILVLISGTHGVEGYCGSAVQSYLLGNINNYVSDLGGDIAIIMVHALNPWGMLWSRRCDQEGIDINRNFVDFSKKLPVEKRYDEVFRFLEASDFTQRNSVKGMLVSRWGQAEFDRIFSGGQYHCSWAPFYGGEDKSFSRKIIEDVVNKWNLADKELVVIDIHTGLGPFAYGELISDHFPDSHGAKYCKQLFGPAISETLLGESFSVAKTGLQDYYWHQMMEKRGCFLTLEFGTYGTAALFNVLLSEHLYWRDNPAPTVDCFAYRLHQKAMKNHFFPKDTLWQQAVLFKSWQVFSRVVRYFNE